MVNGNVGAGQEHTLFVRAPVYCIVEEVATHAAIVKQCVPLGRCPVADHALAPLLCINKEAKKLQLRIFNFRPEAFVRCKPIQLRTFLFLQQGGNRDR